MKRLLSTLTVTVAVAALFLGVSYPVGQGRAREDARRCSPPPHVTARDMTWTAGLQRWLTPAEVRKLCSEDLRAERWGPWNAWNPCCRNED